MPALIILFIGLANWKAKETTIIAISVQNDVLQYLPKELSISGVQISFSEAYKPISAQFPVTLTNLWG